LVNPKKGETPERGSSLYSWKEHNERGGAWRKARREERLTSFQFALGNFELRKPEGSRGKENDPGGGRVIRERDERSDV